jgi:hypothetical protein
MSARLSFVAFGCLALAACSSGAGEANGPADSGSTGSGTAGSSSGGGGRGGLPMCQVDIVPIVPASFERLEAGPTTKVRVQGDVTGTVPPSYDWSWSVSLADGTPVPVTTVGVDPSLVEFPMTTIGTYTIAVQLTGTTCVGLRTITAVRPGAKLATFRLHVTPPSTALVPAQDLERQVTGGTPSAGNMLTLDPGLVVGFDVTRAADGTALPSYVRLTEATSGAILETRTSAAGPNTLRVAQGTYATLVVPDDDVAPLALPARSAGDLGGGSLALDDGPMVTGMIVDGGGLPIKGATVVLRGGDQVSTTGTTDATGAFHVHARAGMFGLTVVSPLAAGGLEAKLAPEVGLVVAATGPTPPLAIALQTGGLVTGSVALSGDPASLTPETRVSLSAVAPLANVGTLTIGAEAPRPLAGDVRFSLHPAADGTVATGGVPPGQYELTVFPAAATTSDGVTKAILDLSKGSVGPMPMTLAKKVMLTGKLMPAAEAWGTTLVAVDVSGLPIVSQGDAGPDGSFALAVSPRRQYQLRALPRPDQVLARASFPVVTVTDAAPAGQSYAMPPALLYAGRVVDPNLQGVATALVQAYCFATAPGCTDPTVPVAETVTRSDGTFELMLPDPDGTP